MINILLIEPEGKGTIARLTHNLYLAFSKREDVNVYIANVNYQDNDDFIVDRQFNFMNKYHFPLGKLVYYVRCVFFIKRLKKDLTPLITISTSEACSTYNVLSKGNGRNIGIFHSSLIYSKNKTNNIWKYLLQYFSFCLLYRYLDKLYCVSPDVKTFILENFSSISPFKVSILYNIHDIQQIIKLSNVSIENLLFSSMNEYIVFVGRLDYNKSPDKVIRAFAEFSMKREGVGLLIIGGDTHCLLHKLKNLCSELEILHKVIFLGNVSNPYKYIKKAKFLVLPSKSEALPGVIIESLILNIPVITTNSSMGIWDIMDCTESYDKNLLGTFIASKGIITSNLCKENCFIKSELNIDEMNLVDSMSALYDNDILYQNMANERSLFLSKITEEFVLNKILLENV